MKTIKPSKYTNDNPPINDKKWEYHKYNDILARFKAMGWLPPSERKVSIERNNTDSMLRKLPPSERAKK